MRLIDADELIKRIGKWMPKDPCGREQTVEEVVETDIAASVFMEIEETPTAFDKEKVIKELMKCSDDPCTLHECGVRSEYCSACMAKKAIEIVEKGGVKHD